MLKRREKKLRVSISFCFFFLTRHALHRLERCGDIKLLNPTSSSQRDCLLPSRRSTTVFRLSFFSSAHTRTETSEDEKKCFRDGGASMSLQFSVSFPDTRFGIFSDAVFFSLLLRLMLRGKARVKIKFLTNEYGEAYEETNE